MKRYFLLTGIAMLFSISLFAQEVENQLSKFNQNLINEKSPITDTLVFNLPNEGTFLLYFNNQEHSVESLQEEFQPILENATKFPEFETKGYRIAESFSSTRLEAVKYEVENKYVQHLDSLEFTFPVGLDYTGGDFTPVAGFRTHLNLRNFSFGGSITNHIYFPPRLEKNIKVNSSWFVNAEFSWEKYSRENKKNTVGIGLLMNDTKSDLFSGTTVRAFYKHQLNKNIAIEVGIVGTENLKTFYPTIGVRFW